MLFKKTIIAAWMASLLLSTAGVSIHRVYCFCSKKAAVSVFFSPKDDCNKVKFVEKGDSCCKKLATTTPCCKNNHRCTDRSIEFSKLDAKFISTNFSPQLDDYQLVAIVAHPIFGKMRFPDAPKNLLPGNKAPPAPASGRALRQRLCSFQC